MREQSIQLADEWWANIISPPAQEYCPMRHLALIVIESAVHDLEFTLKNGRRQFRGGWALAFESDPVLFLTTREVIEPWCTLAGIAPCRLRRRVEQMLGQQLQRAA